jgi:CheY-like chemotaxis protein
MPSLAGVRVLVVDDDTDMRVLTGVILDHAGASVECASSAESALEALARFQPQLVVSDIAMPDVDGYDLVRRIKALDASMARVPCVALTAFATREHGERARAAGFSMHLGKPIHPVALVGALRRLLDSD